MVIGFASASEPPSALCVAGGGAGVPAASEPPSALPVAGIARLTPHELRHTAASLAIASGADIKVVQQMLGHKSAVMTLDQYGHLFGDRLDVVADAMDAAREQALADVSGMCQEAGVVQLR
jgi:Phage integrase family